LERDLESIFRGGVFKIVCNKIGQEETFALLRGWRGHGLRFARLVTHYWRHAAFLEEDQLIRDAPKLNGIPGVLIHGRYDVSGPLVTAWQLSRRWTTSRLHILDDAGHGGGNEFMPLVLGALKELAAL
jgi:proline iminopeptidase